MIDLHTHLLPGVDDGARDTACALAVLAGFAADGVTAVACTPHLRASALRGGPPRRHDRALDALAAALAARAGAAPALLHGWEVLLDEPGADLTHPALRLGDAPAVLVEFPRGPALPPRAADELARIRASGVVPVVAHPERYAGCTPADVRAWRAAGAVVQGNADALTAAGARGARARALLAAGLVDVVASDNHGDARSTADARSLLEAEGAGEAATLLTAENPARVLAGRPPLPVPPARVRAGAWGRVRRAVYRALRKPPRHPPDSPDAHV